MCNVVGFDWNPFSIHDLGFGVIRPLVPFSEHKGQT